MKIREIESKSIVTDSKLPETEYTINPYIGCQHGCIYCYSKFMKGFTDHDKDWGSFVDVKINAPNLIKTDGRYEGKNIFFSSVTDPYQSIEVKYRLTRRILKKLIKEQPKLEILTKSNLVLKDLDILKQFKEVRVGISISSLKYHKKLEPGAPSPEKRINAVKEINEAGIETYVFVSPIIPYITKIEEIINKTAPYVDYFMFENLNLRPINRKQMERFIKEFNLRLWPKYEQIYDSENKKYWERIKKCIKDTCEDYGKEYKIYFHHGGFS